MNHAQAKTLTTAAAIAALFAGGMTTAIVAQAEEAKIHCGGVTSCKGTSDCKTSENACKGQNVCKGHGFKLLTPSDCAAKGGQELK